MAREKLNVRKIAALKDPGRYGDGGGLWLQVSRWGTKAWVFQFVSPTQTKIDANPKSKRHGQEVGRVRQFGLGPLATVSLAEARVEADKARKLVRDGIDPVDAKGAKRQAQQVQQARSVTLKKCAEEYLERHRSSWRSIKHAGQWARTLAAYAYPVIGNVSVAQIDSALINKVLEPIWSAKPETANRVRGRLEKILDFAKVRGYRDGENPARWRGHLDKVWPATAKVRAVTHYAALPYDEIGPFFAKLRAREDTAARALEFTILTAARTGEIIRATWDEIDLTNKTWTVPASRMKANKEHRVPLSDRALAILRGLPREPGNDHVFIGGRAGMPLPHIAMLAVLRDLRPGLTVHGFRSSFSDWAHELTAHSNHTIELSLAHSIGAAAERAYRRGDMFEKRRQLMQEWARYW
jgi:integrase